MTRSCHLLEQLRRVGHKLDSAAPDHDAMRFLLRGRRALAAAIEAARPAAPLRFTPAEREIAEVNQWIRYVHIAIRRYGRKTAIARFRIAARGPRREPSTRAIKAAARRHLAAAAADPVNVAD